MFGDAFCPSQPSSEKKPCSSLWKRTPPRANRGTGSTELLVIVQIKTIPGESVTCIELAVLGGSPRQHPRCTGTPVLLVGGWVEQLSRGGPWPFSFISHGLPPESVSCGNTHRSERACVRECPRALLLVAERSRLTGRVALGKPRRRMW